MGTLAASSAQLLLAVLGAGGLLLVALLAPGLMLPVLALPVALLAALLLYQRPALAAGLMVLTYGVALDIQIDLGMLSGGGGTIAALGMAIVKFVPFALTAALLLRFGPAPSMNWPFLAFTAIAALSVAVLPTERIITQAEMLRSFIGSTAPFVLAFTLAPRRVWSVLIKGAAVLPMISAGLGVLAGIAGLYPAFDDIMRFQGLHVPPYLAGYALTGIMAATLEYLRGWRLPWLAVAGIDLAILLGTQARTPLIGAGLFLGIVFLFSGPRLLPLRRKVDLVMGGMVPAAILLGPLLVYALRRFFGDDEFNFSGRDVIWPYFLEAIEARPLFGFGLGAGKLIVNPEDPRIRLLGSNAAHNEYLRLSVDAGIIGCTAIFVALIAWVWGGSRHVPPAERLVLRAALAAILLFSASDNTLIASMAVMQFSLLAAILARGRAEWGRGPARAAARGAALPWRASPAA